MLQEACVKLEVTANWVLIHNKSALQVPITLVLEVGRVTIAQHVMVDNTARERPTQLPMGFVKQATIVQRALERKLKALRFLATILLQEQQNLLHVRREHGILSLPNHSVQTVRQDSIARIQQ